MNKLFIHVPTFVETDVYPSYEFETIEQLLESGNIDTLQKVSTWSYQETCS